MSDPLPEGCSCGALREAARHITRLYDAALNPAGLGLNQYSILSKLDRFGPKTLQELADILVMDRSTLGHLLRPLEARGVIAMKPAPNDKRVRIIALTTSGHALMRQAKPLWAKAENAFRRQFSEATAASLRALLKDVTRIELGANTLAA